MPPRVELAPLARRVEDALLLFRASSAMAREPVEASVSYSKFYARFRKELEAKSRRVSGF